MFCQTLSKNPGCSLLKPLYRYVEKITKATADNANARFLKYTEKISRVVRY